MSAQVAVFGATRADLFPLAPVLAGLAEAPDLDAVLLASGTTGQPDFGDPLAALDLRRRPRRARRRRPRARATCPSLTERGARIAAAMAEALHADPARRCSSCSATAGSCCTPCRRAVLGGVPLVHLHGGEVTEGAIDDRIRHAVSKLADLHCVSTERGRGPAAPARRAGRPGRRHRRAVAGPVRRRRAGDRRAAGRAARVARRPPVRAGDLPPGHGRRHRTRLRCPARPGRGGAARRLGARHPPRSGLAAARPCWPRSRAAVAGTRSWSRSPRSAPTTCRCSRRPTSWSATAPAASSRRRPSA